MSDGALLPGAIVWYRPDAGRGVVRLDSGRQYTFNETRELIDPVGNLRVRVSIEPRSEGEVAVVVGLPGGKREFAPPPAASPRPATPMRSRVAAPPKAPAGKRPAKAGPASGIANRMRRKPDGSYPVGMSVRHPQFGQGFIVMCAPKVARVRFMPNEEERTVRVADLTGLE